MDQIMNIAEQLWDVVVVGAGPAGAMAALSLAERGATVLLVDRAEFPRPKVCGCCLSGAALAELDAAHLHGLVEELGAIPLDDLRLYVSNGRARLRLTKGAGLSRAAFDMALVQQAIQRGTTFLSGTSARLISTHSDEVHVKLRRGSETHNVRARVMLAADGLSGTSLNGDERFAKRDIAGYSLIGANTIVNAAPTFYEPGSIFMACDDGGYVGLVRIEDGRLDIAAALNPDYVRRIRSPAAAVAGILKAAGLPPLALEQSDWHGTPYLTSRRKCLAAQRVFVIGDAAGYVEPFTGEGIAWALASGRCVTDVACEAVSNWRPELANAWVRRHRRLLGGRQRICRWITLGLRRPRTRRLAVQALAVWPRLGETIAHILHRPFGQYSPLSERTFTPIAAYDS